jgi:hypothetical protein
MVVEEHQDKRQHYGRYKDNWRFKQDQNSKCQSQKNFNSR